MFVPCDHCLRKHATHVSEVNDRGEPEALRLCKECHERLKEDLARRQPPELDPSLTLTERERAIAESLQANLLPRTLPRVPGYDLSAWFRASREVGGSTYDFFELDDERLGLVVADVSGNGIPGMIILTEARALLKSEAVRVPSPAETLARVNRVLHKDIRRGMFVTMHYAVLNPARATLTCASAGHSPGVWWRKSGESLELINPNGLALGIDPGLMFERTIREQTIELSAGDRFTLYTDGVLEARNERNEELGPERLHEHIKKLSEETSEDFIRRLAAEVDRHRGSRTPERDMAIVTLRRNGAPFPA